MPLPKVTGVTDLQQISLWWLCLYMWCSVMNIMNAYTCISILIQYLFLSLYSSTDQNHLSSSVDSDLYTILFSRYVIASVILLLHHSSVNKKFILCSYNLQFVCFCSSENRSKAERAGALFRLNESVESMIQMTRS